jgi:hypothetical protein
MSVHGMNPPMLIDAAERRLRRGVEQMRDEQKDETRAPIRLRRASPDRQGARTEAIELVEKAIDVLERVPLEYVVGVDVAKEGHRSRHVIQRVQIKPDESVPEGLMRIEV